MALIDPYLVHWVAGGLEIVKKNGPHYWRNNGHQPFLVSPANDEEGQCPE